MNASQQVTLSPAEAEEFWADEDGRPAAPGSGPGIIEHLENLTSRVLRSKPYMDADRPETPEPDCCAGADSPGVGRVHSPDCPHAGSPVRSGRGYVAGEVPQPLRGFVGDPACESAPDVFGVQMREVIAEIDGAIDAINARKARREGLFAQLLFAARNLAEANIVRALRDGGGYIYGEPLSCRECHFGATSAGVLRHATSCNTRCVLGLVVELMALQESQPSEKEVAPDGEKGRADDGIRLRGLKLQTCLQCGERGGVWDAEERPETEIDLGKLALNQCVGASSHLPGHVLYTHRCRKGGAQ